MVGLYDLMTNLLNGLHAAFKSYEKFQPSKLMFKKRTCSIYNNDGGV